MTMLYDRIAIIGTGHIGASIAIAAREHNLVGEIVVYDNDKTARARLTELGIGDRVAATATDAVANANLVILAIPVGVMGEVAAAIAPHIMEGATITDTGSTKISVIRDVAPLLPPHCHFLPSHPLAGTEHSGPDAGFATLFKDRYWVVLDSGVDEKITEKYMAFVTALGARAETMNDAGYHDSVLAITSHLPHLIAYTIVGTAFDFEQDIRNDVIRFSASGFRDFTRIAASDPVMWRDVFLHNREAMMDMLERFRKDLEYLERAIDESDGEKLEDLFTRTRDIRTRIRDMGQLD